MSDGSGAPAPQIADAGGFVFVYDADSGLINSILNSASRACIPNGEHCALYTLTLPIGGQRRWTQIIASLGGRVEFLYRDQLATRFGSVEAQPPVILHRRGSAFLNRFWV